MTIVRRPSRPHSTRSIRPNRDYVVLDTEHLAEVVEYFVRQPAFAFDLETMAPDEQSPETYRGEPCVNRIVWIALATEGMAVTIPLGHPNGDRLLVPGHRKMLDKEARKFTWFPPVFDAPPSQLYPSEVFAALEPLFFGDKTIIAHNAPFDLGSIAKYYGGRVPEGETVCTITLQWLLNENLLQKGLKERVKATYKVDYDQEKVGRKIEEHPFWKVAHYAYLDVRYTWLIYKRLRPYIDEADLVEVFNLENQLTRVVTKMNLNGIRVDMDALLDLKMEMMIEKIELEGQIYREAGRKFNINSNAQLAEVLFASKEDGGQGLKARYWTPAGKKMLDAGKPLQWKHHSVAADTLANYKGNKLVDLLARHAVVNKLLGTYVESYLGTPDKPAKIINGKIHGRFNQYGTVTGRLSSSDPNLQNIPRPGEEDGDLGKKVRSLFIADPGCSLAGSDYDQIEVRLLAHFAGTGPLKAGIEAGLDPHSATAAQLIGMDIREFARKKAHGDPEIKVARQVAKGVNFAVIYGAGAPKVASMTNTTVTKAKGFMATHEKAFPEVYQFKKNCLAKARARKPPHIRTLAGRKRRVRELMSAEYGLRGQAERQTINSLIQGSSGDITKAAMVYLDNILPDDMKLVLSVHDELVIQFPDGRDEEARRYLSEAMLGEHIQGRVRVPITADSVTAKSWGRMKD